LFAFFEADQMEKLDIKTKLEEILTHENVQEHVNAGKELVKEFWNIYNEEQKTLKEKQADLEAELEFDAESVALDEEIKILIEDFKSKRENLEKSIVNEETKNLEIKQGLIIRLRNLIQHEENIGTLFNEIKEIQGNWKEIGNIPRKVAQEINQEYHNLTEQFYYNVNIYKELQENDLKKNFSLKNQIIHQMKDLLKEKRINDIQNQLRVLQNDWAEVGPTYQEHWDKLKEDYYNTQNEIYDKIRTFYDNRKEQQAKNIEIKNGMVEKAKALLAELPTDLKDWEKVTKNLVELQDAWKKVGYGPTKENKEVWKEFRGVYNDFFEEKSKIYKVKNSEFEENAKKKTQLIERVLATKGADDFKRATEQVLSLQKQWKNIGHAGRHQEQKLWKKFRTACDGFFNSKDAHFKQQKDENKANLALKNKMIEEIKAYKPKKDKKETIGDLKEFSRKYAAIGNVPFKDKDTINKLHKEELNKHYDGLKMSPLEKEKIMFESKLQQMMSSSTPGKMIQAEKERIRKKITYLNAEINQYENNLGFFKVSKGAEALLGDVNAKIDDAKSQIDRLKNQLRLIPKETK
jgi:hypothetical protein